MNEKELLTIQEAAKLLKVQPRTLYRLIAEGKFPRSVHRLAGEWRLANPMLFEEMREAAEQKIRESTGTYKTDEKQLLRLAEAAKLLDVHPEHLRRLIKTGKLRKSVHKVGRSWRFDREALLEEVHKAAEQDLNESHE